jgi:hypothetical protein
VSGLVILLLVVALLVGGVGLFVEGLIWLLIISVALFVISGLVGSRGRAA